MIVSQGPCPYPECTHSSNGYTEYDDGGFHCFSCGKHGNGSQYHALLHPKTEVKTKGIELPEDTKITNKMLKALPWLRKYGMTDAEIDDNCMLWSEQKQYLIFPVFDETKKILMWQARYFGDNPKHPKYITRGFKDDVMHILGKGKSDFLVLTEDLISAIKVSRQFTAMPVWGSCLSNNMGKRLSKMYENVYLWLDYDKRNESVKQSIKHSLYLTIKPIITTLDPKCYDDLEIKQYLND